VWHSTYIAKEFSKRFFRENHKKGQKMSGKRGILLSAVFLSCLLSSLISLLLFFLFADSCIFGYTIKRAESPIIYLPSIIAEPFGTSIEHQARRTRPGNIKTTNL